MTAGPGLTNTVTAVKNAQMAESPLLLIGGAAGTLLQVKENTECTECEFDEMSNPSMNNSVLQGRGALQDIDQMSLFKPLCKFCASVRTVREIDPTSKRIVHYTVARI